MENYKSKFTEAMDARGQLQDFIDELVVAVDEALRGDKGASLSDIENIAEFNNISLEDVKKMIMKSQTDSEWFAKEAIIKAMELNK